MIVISNLLRVVGFVGYLAVRSFPALVVTAFIVQVGSRAFYSSYTPLIAQVAPRGQRDVRPRLSEGSRHIVDDKREDEEVERVQRPSQEAGEHGITLVRAVLPGHR